MIIRIGNIVLVQTINGPRFFNIAQAPVEDLQLNDLIIDGYSLLIDSYPIDIT